MTRKTAELLVWIVLLVVVLTCMGVHMAYDPPAWEDASAPQ